MNWHHWYWWMLPASIAFGFAWSFVLMCVIPPRDTPGEWLRNWKGLFPWAARRHARRRPGNVRSIR